MNMNQNTVAIKDCKKKLQTSIYLLDANEVASSLFIICSVAIKILETQVKCLNYEITRQPRQVSIVFVVFGGGTPPIFWVETG